MTRTRSLFLLWLGVSLALMAGCGPKRPPAVAGPGGVPGAGGAGGYGTTPSAEKIEEGPDIRAVDTGGALGEDVLSDPSGEGGPLADVYFEFDSAELTDAARATLERHALWLQSRRELRVTLEGHCDERGTVEYNLALGEQRARAARDYLASLGVGAERMSSVSYGKERPLDPGSGEAAWARNRRAHFAVSR